MPGCIYFVGKPYPHPEAIDMIRRLGYLVGLFQDKTIRLKHPERYDNIIALDFSDPKKILQVAKTLDLQVDGLICTYENYIVAKTYLAEYFKVPAITKESAEKCTDKYLMRQAFLKADKDITPKFSLVSSKEELVKAAAEMRFPLIIKPTNLIKSLLVLRCNDEDELLGNFAYAQERIGELYRKYKIYDHEPRLIVEEYVLGKTCSVAAFVDASGVAHFCEGIVDLVNAQDRGVADNYIFARHLPGKFNNALSTRLFEVAREGIKALGMTSTPAHVELIYNEDEVKLIEIGARIGGYRPRMYNYSYGSNLIEQEIKLALGQTPDLSGSFKAFSSVFEIFPEKEGKFQTIEGASETSSYTYFAIKPKMGDTVGPAREGYKACAVIIISSEDEQTHRSMCKAVENIKVRTA